jgi:NADH:ubiquinone oxidoreductase subunit 2 (subunit N)
LSIALSSYNFIIFFISIEAVTLCILFLISYAINKAYRSKILIYFVVNSIASLFLLFGIVIIYGLFGTFSYKLISIICLFSFNDNINIILNMLLNVSLFFIFFSLVIKIGLAPLHL